MRAFFPAKFHGIYVVILRGLGWQFDCGCYTRFDNCPLWPWHYEFRGKKFYNCTLWIFDNCTLQILDNLK